MKLSVGRKKLTAVALHDTAIFAGGFTSDVGSNNCGDRVRTGMGCYRREVDIYNATSHRWTTALLAQGRMRLASAADPATDCAVFAGGEVNVSHNDATGIVDVFCGGVWCVVLGTLRRDGAWSGSHRWRAERRTPCCCAPYHPSAARM